MTVSAGKEHAGIEDGEIEARSCAEFTDIHVAAEGARRTSAEFAVDGRSDAHYAAKGTKRHDCRSEGASFVWEQLPMKEVWLAEPLF